MAKIRADWAAKKAHPKKLVGPPGADWIGRLVQIDELEGLWRIDGYDCDEESWFCSVSQGEHHRIVGARRIRG